MSKSIDKARVAEKRKHRDWLKSRGVNHDKAKALAREDDSDATAQEIADGLRAWARGLKK